MTDLEMTKLSAQAMYKEIRVQEETAHYSEGIFITKYGEDVFEYKPLHDDAQCFALVKKFELVIEPEQKSGGGPWGVTIFTDTGLRGKGRIVHVVRNAANLNRAIVQCVAQMQAAKAGA